MSTDHDPRTQLEELLAISDDLEARDDWACRFVTNVSIYLEESGENAPLSPAQIKKIDELWSKYVGGGG